MVMTQRCGLFMVWNMNGTIGSTAAAPLSGISFTASGTKNISINWSDSANLDVAVFSYSNFSLS